MSRYAGKVALVTGGGSGLGAEFCRRFAREGAKVGVLDVDSTGGEKTAGEIASAGGEAIFVHADVTDEASMVKAVATVTGRFGQLDTAVNNAGIGGGMHPITEFPADAWKQTIMVNLYGVFLSLRAEIPAMLERGGAIINISSMVGFIAHPYTSAYVASKHGVVGLTKSAALEWGHKNIRVNAVGPTWVRTPLTESVLDTEEAWAKLDAEHPLGRCATPDDIASLVAFLGSEDAKIITGSLYLADGGQTAR